MTHENPEPKRKRRENARAAAARAIQRRDGTTYHQALARADAKHQKRNVIAWDPAALGRCAAALDDAHTALRAHATTTTQLRAAADLTAWLAQAVHQWPRVQHDECPPFPGELSTTARPELHHAAASLHSATLALDDCSGAATTALQDVLARLENWCSRPAKLSAAEEVVKP